MKRRAAHKLSLSLLMLILTLQGLYMGAAGETKASMSIAASVAVEGGPVSEAYTLRLTAAESYCPMPEGKLGGTYDLVLTGAGSKSFPALTFGAAGSYKYTIAQVPGSHALAASYDDTVYELEVLVRDESGKLQLTAVLNRKGSDKKASSADFKNVYLTPVVIEHNPPVRKKITGDKPATAATFYFTFKSVSNTAGLSAMPMPEGSTNGVKKIATTAGVKKEFGAMTFTAPGQYVYQIAEVNDKQTGYTYDKSVYTVTYNVTREGNGLACSRTMAKNGKAVAQAEYVFTNKYTKTSSSSSSGTTPPPGKKPKAMKEVRGTKIWEDEGNVNGTRPGGISIHLLANGAPVSGAKPKWTRKSRDRWGFSFGRLPAEDDQGREIEYTVTEDAVPYYETDISGLTITNTLEAREPSAYTQISGQKTWNDNDNIDGRRPRYIVLNLLRDGKPLEQRTVSEASGWSYTFNNLPVDSGYGHTYTYTVREEATSGYLPRYSGNDVLNTMLPAETEKKKIEDNHSILSQIRILNMEQLEDLLTLFGYTAPRSGLLDTGDNIPLCPFAFGVAGVMALAALLVIEGKRRAKQRGR